MGEVSRLIIQLYNYALFMPFGTGGAALMSYAASGPQAHTSCPMTSAPSQSRLGVFSMPLSESFPIHYS